MALDPYRLKNWPFEVQRQTYGVQESMLYALSLGVGNHPLDEASLRYVYEGSHGGPLALPTMAAVLCYPGFWARHPDSGIDWRRLVHGEQRLVIHRPLRAADTVVGHNKVTHVTDKGDGRGALVVIERRLRNEVGEPLATLQQINFCRGDGGFSARGLPSDPPLEALAAVPADRGPDAVEDNATRPEAALLYRLNSDDNPLHADPSAARAAGFERPILHGLATWGIAARALIRQCAADDPARMRGVACRFAAAVLPGDTLRTEIWRENDTSLRFQTRAIERDCIVLSHGEAILAVEGITE